MVHLRKRAVMVASASFVTHWISLKTRFNAQFDSTRAASVRLRHSACLPSVWMASGLFLNEKSLISVCIISLFGFCLLWCFEFRQFFAEAFLCSGQWPEHFGEVAWVIIGFWVYFPRNFLRFSDEPQDSFERQGESLTLQPIALFFTKSRLGRGHHHPPVVPSQDLVTPSQYLVSPRP